MEKDFELLTNYTSKLNDLIFKIKQDVLSFLSGDISKNHLLNLRKKELENSIEELNKLYRIINKEEKHRIFDSILLKKTKENIKKYFKEKEDFEIENFTLKPFSSTLEKILRYSFSKEGEKGIALSDLVRSRITTIDEYYQIIKDLVIGSLYDIVKDNDKLSLVYHNQFKVSVKDIKAYLRGYVFENIFREGNIYSYFIIAKDSKDANEIYRSIKDKVRSITRKFDKRKTYLSPLYKIDLEKCYEEIFKGLNIYLSKKENEVVILVIENQLLKNEKIKDLVNKILTKEFKNYLGLLAVENEKNMGKMDIYNSFAIRPHTAIEKVEKPYLFSELGISLPSNWYYESIIDEKDLSEKFLKEQSNRSAIFSNLNFALGEIKCENTRFYPLGEIQIQTYSIKRLNSLNPNFNHKNYELKRLNNSFIKPLNSLIRKYLKNHKRKVKNYSEALLEYLEPLINNSISKKTYIGEKGRDFKVIVGLNKDYLFEIKKR